MAALVAGERPSDQPPTGVRVYNTSPQILLPPSSFSKTGTDFAWGVGVQAHMSMFGARLEYELQHPQYALELNHSAFMSALWVYARWYGKSAVKYCPDELQLAEAFGQIPQSA